MELTINGEKRTIDNVDTLEGLVQVLGFSIEKRGIAVAVNDTVVPRVEWGSTQIQEGDTVEVIHAVQGG
jgi:sulfur carrier protein